MADEFLIEVVEDDSTVANLIMTTLKVEQYPFIWAKTAEEAIELCVKHQPDMILLDLGLPDHDGIEVIRNVRSWSGLPIMIISARDDDLDKIKALDAGADDYLTKPFSVNELLARIRATRRRLAYLNETKAEKPVFVNDRLTVDYAAGIARLNGETLHLTPIEYKLLCVLAKNAGKVLTHTYLIREIWKTPVETDIVSLRVYMASLRKKLGDGTSETPYIRTYVGTGYMMNRF